MTHQRDEQTYAIIGAAMEVHRVLGPGFLEAVYHNALALELTDRGVPYVSEHELPVMYKGRRLNVGYRADLWCFDRVIVELKAASGLTSVDEAQLLNYLKATGCEVGLLLNFGTLSLQHKRLILSHKPSPAPPAI